MSADSPVAVCPNCQRNTILVIHKGWFLPEREVGGVVSGISWGESFLTPSEEAFCNASGCRWSGTLGQAVQAAEGTTESTRGHFRIWIPREVEPT